MEILYVDAFSGISGDMILGAMIDLGLSVERLEALLKQHLHLPEYQLSAYKITRSSITGTKLEIKISDPVATRNPINAQQILNLIETSSLESTPKQKSLQIVKRLAEAEAKVHGVKMDDVHFHELGGIDTIIDIVGAVLGIGLLGYQKVISSPLNLGSGSFTSSHGTFPIPAPATLELLKGIPAYGSPGHYELTTPTGAAIITTLAQQFSPMPLMRVEKFGYGAGSQDIPERPNLLRLIQGESLATLEEDEVTVIETNIDNMNPEFYQHIMDRLFQQGALDVTLTPITMKKGRPAVKLTILSDYPQRDRLIRILFEESTTIGVRLYQAQRKKLSRDIKLIDTCYGQMRVKLGYLDGRLRQISPELADCQDLAEKLGVPIKDVYDEVKAAARELLADPCPGD